MILLLLYIWCLNPLSPVDAYLRQIIECAKGPLTHIYVKDEGVRFNRPFGSCKRAMSMSISVQAQKSFFYILTTSPAPLATRSLRKQAPNFVQGCRASPSTNRYFKNRREAS